MRVYHSFIYLVLHYCSNVVLLERSRTQPLSFTFTTPFSFTCAFITPNRFHPPLYRDQPKPDANQFHPPPQTPSPPQSRGIPVQSRNSHLPTLDLNHSTRTTLILVHLQEATKPERTELTCLEHIDILSIIFFTPQPQFFTTNQPISHSTPSTRVSNSPK